MDVALALGGLSHLDPGPPRLVLLSCRARGTRTAREIRTRFSLRLSQDSDFSNLVRAKAERLRGGGCEGRDRTQEEGRTAGAELTGGRESQKGSWAGRRGYPAYSLLK